MTIFLCRCATCGKHFSSRYPAADNCGSHPIKKRPDPKGGKR